MTKMKDAIVLTEAEYAALLKAAEDRRKRRRLIKSITSYLFVTTQAIAIIWVSVSYAIAAYATIILGQPFPIEELSRTAITTLLGVNTLKVLENIFEHNDGPVWGTTNKTQTTEHTSPIPDVEAEG